MRPQVLLIDHFDSFTYNLVQLLRVLGAEVLAVRSDAVTEQLWQCPMTHLVLSPGPGHPDDVPAFQQALERWCGTVPILGVCLGHQALCRFAGLVIDRAAVPMHGKTSPLYHSGTGIFAGIENGILVMRYHSLVAVPDGNPDVKVIATTADGMVMAVELTRYPNSVGVQFHPESYFTMHGQKMLENFLAMK